ncbi:hypothetical protein CXB51_018601 [Gossypium anomalum]|uniref:Bidirectional sugar transporter SWEET n=1 Tax=Gossypium anomalum TaxID=47600 RepID=A0A8J6CUI6_9ROSI|nr:hypothetical protein CXB51_018601 [Gossypium anomalum]
MVYLAPLPTFVRVYKKKSTEGFESLPYVVALVSAVLWIYYATLKPNAFLLMTINSIGCVVETIYIIVFIVYAPKKARILTLKLLLVFNMGALVLVLITHFFSKGRSRIHVIGWSCVVTSAAVFAAPLSIMRSVIHTKSVEFMPFTLSFFLTCSAILWLVYGLLLKDFYISWLDFVKGNQSLRRSLRSVVCWLPNIVGVVLGTIQMLLYVVYKKFNNNFAKDQERKQPSPIVNGKNMNHIKASNIDSLPRQVSGDIEVGRDENLYGPQLEHSDDEA